MRSSLALVLCLCVELTLFGCDGTVIPEESGPDRAGCVNPVPIPQSDGQPSGFVECGDGFIHRAERVACASSVPVGDCDGQDPEGSECLADGDCTAGAFGSCQLRGKESFPSQGCECHYGCAVDADCGAGEICACAGVVGGRNRCVTANCAETADCGNGLCGLDRRRGACGEWRGALACIDSTTACRIDADCQEVPMECPTNTFSDLEACKVSEGEWICGFKSCGPCG